MKVALAQLNPTVGDLRGNCRKIIDYAEAARRSGADLMVCPELCVTGYPPLDLLENRHFLRATDQAVAWVASRLPAGLAVVLGTPRPNESPHGKRLFNAAVVLEGGRSIGHADKCLLPTYDVFDEYRYFEPATRCAVFQWKGKRIGLHVCEDMWNSGEHRFYHAYERNPIDELAAQGIDFFVNISASPFSAGKAAERDGLIGTICRKHQKPFVLVNQVGANTEIIFDGDSRVQGPDGELVLNAPSFEEALLVWDMSAPNEAPAVVREAVGALHDALVLGIRDYFEKTGFFSNAVVGLSGGIDSAVTCALAAAALGPDRVVGLTMPSEISSEGSVTDSVELARRLGINCHVVPIGPAVQAFDHMLEDLFEGTESGIAEENVQARSRGLTLMAYSNKFGALLLSTGNKSEMAVGYATLYGDMNGGLAVLSDVFKTQVYELADYINERAGRDIIPRNTIDKPPSAELRPGQLDQDSLPPYPVLDRILRLYIEELREYQEIVALTQIDSALILDVLKRVDQNEYKRRQAPPGLRVSPKAFGIGRRLPIVMRWDREQDWHALSGSTTVSGTEA